MKLSKISSFLASCKNLVSYHLRLYFESHHPLLYYLDAGSKLSEVFPDWAFISLPELAGSIAYTYTFVNMKD